MTSFITLPGIGGSGDDHWQTFWERSDSRFTRFQPASWDKPELADWIAALDRTVRAAEEPPVLVAHSLACLLVAHWAYRTTAPVAGACLVCIPDPSGPPFPAEASSFAEVPACELPFATLVVASTNDPYGTMDHARRRATDWGASLVAAGDLGHINASSDVGDWEQGRALWTAFCAGMGKRA